MLDARILKHAVESQVMLVTPEANFAIATKPSSNVLVKLVDKCGLYHFGLLGCCSSPHGRVLGITRDADFRAIGVNCASAVAIGTAMDRNTTRGD